MQNKSGFTLIEIIVACVVFALTIAGLLSVLVAGTKHIVHTRERITSAELGKLFIDPLQVDVRQDTWNANALSVSAIPVALPSEVVNNRTFSATYTVKDSSSDPTLIGTDLRKVITIVTWNEPTS